MESSSVEYVVKYILPNYSDEHLANMLKQRPGKESILRRAILQEMGNRCAAEYAARYMGSAV